MDELLDKRPNTSELSDLELAISHVLVDAMKSYEFVEDGQKVFFDGLRKAFTDNGYIKLPGNAQNVTITTSDNTHDGKLMTEQEWREKFGE